MSLTLLPKPGLPASPMTPVAIMEKIRQMLVEFVKTEVASRLDLQALCLNDDQLDELADYLGIGEVQFEFNTTHRISIRETAYRGVWWLIGYDDNRQILSECIEVAQIPEVLLTPLDDIAGSVNRIADFA